MKLLKRTSNEHDVKVAALLKENKVEDFYLTEEKYITCGRAFEIWQYQHKYKNHFLIKHLYRPHHLFFIQLEECEVFWPKDFDYYLDHGEFKNEWSLEEVLEDYERYRNEQKK